MPELDGNRSAGPSEAVILRDQLELDAKDAAELETRLLRASTTQHSAEMALLAAQEAVDSASTYTARIREQQELVAQRMLRARGLLHPIRRVPDELLSEIFLFLLEPYLATNLILDEYKSFRRIPFACSAICKRWRVAALSTPRLWSMVALDTNEVSEASMDAWAAYLDMFSSYSKAVSLSTVLLAKHSVDPVIPQVLEPIVRALIGRSHRLHMKIQCETSSGQLHGIQQLLGDTLPNIRDLQIAAHMLSDGTLPTLPGLPAMPRLHSLSLTSVWMLWDQQPLLSTVKAAQFRPGGLFEMNPSLLAMALSTLPALEDLRLVDVFFEDAAPTIIPLPTVTGFHLYAHADTVANVTFRLPVVKDASIALYGGDDITSGIHHLVGSSLCQPSLKRLIVVSPFDAADEFADALKPLGGLLNLYLAQGVARPSFLQRLSQPCGDGTWICPVLERLDLGMGETDVSLLPALSQLVHARENYENESEDAPAVEPLMVLSLVWNRAPSEDDLVDFRADMKGLISLIIWNDLIGI